MKLLIFIFKTILIESIKYLPALLDMFEENKLDYSEHKIVRKSRNKTIKILIKLKS